MTTSELQEVGYWVKYPSFYKNKLRKALEDGTLFAILSNRSVPEELKEQIQTILPMSIKESSAYSLMKVYKKYLPSSERAFTSFTNHFYKEFIRITPSRRFVNDAR